MNAILYSERVQKIFTACLHSNVDIYDGMAHIPVTVDGVLGSVILDQGKLTTYTEEIIAMLNELPREFHDSIGGGWSFLQACNDKNGIQWTGLHMDMDKLFILGIAINKVKYILPKELWNVLPGGMPFLVITT